jgi:hypothetical protein
MNPAEPSPNDRARLRVALDALRRAPWLTPGALLRCGLASLAVTVALLGAGVALSGLAAQPDGHLARDFLNFLAGATAAASGHAAAVYDQRWFQAVEESMTGAPSRQLYSYPPVLLLLSLPLALLSFVPALCIWIGTGFALCLALLARLVGWTPAALALAGAPAAFFNLWNGQNGYFSAALFGGGLMILDRRPVVAGICFGCLAYKPQLGMLLPFALAAGGHWRAIAAAAAAAAALCGASAAVLGGAAWSGFAAQMSLHRQLLELEVAPLLPTVFTAAKLLGASNPACWAAQGISGGLALALTMLIWRRAAATTIKGAALLVALFLASPYVWMHDAVMLIFAAAWLWREGSRTGFLPWERLAVAVLLGFPAVTSVIALAAGIQLAPILLWPVLLLLLLRTGAAAHPQDRGQTSPGLVAVRRIS